MRQHREIIKIDEEKCNGCGLCVPSCAEGAIQIIEGKARLVSEVYCDGLGACLAECPQDALTIEEREAEEFDEEAVEQHLEETAEEETQPAGQQAAGPSGGCPGAMVRFLGARNNGRTADPPPADAAPSQLVNWPVQLILAPTSAPYFEGARLLIASDCVPFALADFHSRFLAERVLLIGCPKLDDADFYRQKLAQIFSENDIHSIDVAYMEVPCCFGMVHLAEQALRDCGKDIPLTLNKVSIRGEVRNPRLNVVEARPLRGLVCRKLYLRDYSVRLLLYPERFAYDGFARRCAPKAARIMAPQYHRILLEVLKVNALRQYDLVVSVFCVRANLDNHRALFAVDAVDLADIRKVFHGFLLFLPHSFTFPLRITYGCALFIVRKLAIHGRIPHAARDKIIM